MARAFRGTFTALYVETPNTAAMSDDDKKRLQARFHAVRTGDVRAAFGSVARAGLRLRVALLMQRRRERKPELLRRRARQQTRLIVAALAHLDAVPVTCGVSC